MINGKFCVITGGTSGLGRATAFALGTMGANLLLVGRNQRAAQSVMNRLRKQAGAGQVEFIPADLSSVTEVHRLANEVRRRCAVVDVLVNNAGARFDDYKTSPEGVELTFATNHLGHFLLTALLLDRLLTAEAGRIVTVASGAHAATLDAGWIQKRDNYDRKAAYSSSKLANIVFTYELARRLRQTTVTCTAVDPGGVATNLGRNNGNVAWLRHLTYYALHGKLQSSRKASQTIVALASRDGAGATGQYYRELKEIRSSAISYDRKVAGELWKLSIDLTGLDATLGATWKFVGDPGSLA